MDLWMIVLLAGLSACSVSYRIPVREILPPPPWHLHGRDSHAGHRVAHAFQRGPVESPPRMSYVDYKESAAIREEFGSHRYPLRDAVEALPPNTQTQPLGDTVESSEREPLRDAVEHREAPFLGGLDHESIWIEPLAPPTLQRTQQIPDPKVVCHLDAKAVYRDEPFSLLPQALPDYKCSHLIYSSATIDPYELTVVSSDPEYDEIKGGYKAATGLRSKDPALQVLLSISSPHRARFFEEITKDHCAVNCRKFARSLLSFLGQHDFNGVEIDWENSGEHPRELKLLLESIRSALQEKGYILAVALRQEDEVDPSIASLVDLILLRAWRESPSFRRDKLALHPAPLKFVLRMANKWAERVPVKSRSKIILGLPAFGQSYTLKFGNATDVGAPVVGPGIEGTYTKERSGRLAYYEVCEKLEEGLWVSGRDEEGPYLKRGDQWIGYEDPISAKIKTAYVRSAGLGGVSLSSLDLDDFQGICGNPWPMLDAVTKAIGFYNEASIKRCSKEGLFSDPKSCSGFYACFNGVQHRGNCGFGRFFNSANGRCVKASAEMCQPGQSDAIPLEIVTDVREIQEPQNSQLAEMKGPRVVCYVTSWALYRKGDGKFVPERVDSNLCTDVVYAFAGLNPDTLLVQPFDPWADIENSLYGRVTSIRGSRILLALGGWTDSAGDKYSRLISSGASRRKFVAATVNFLAKYNFHGLSLEWNYPKCWQSDCRKGPDSDKPNFTKLVQELRKEFDRQKPRLTLAVAFSGYKEVIDKAYEVLQISREVDFMSVMTYDYHGAWESKSGHLSPLFSAPGDDNPFYNVNFTMEYLAKQGAEKSKLLLGIPLYGQAYRLSNERMSDLGDPTTGPGVPGEFTRQPGMLAYYEICDRIKNQHWKTGAGPNAHHKDQWVGYDDRESVFAKGQYILQNGYGGATMWTIDLDDFTNRCCRESYPLLKTVNRALGRLKTPAPIAEDCRRPTEPITPQAPTLTTHSDAADGGPRPTSPMTTTIRPTKHTTWPSWTEKPISTSQQTTRTTWPSWTWTQKPTIQSTTRKPTSKPATTTRKPTTVSSTSWTTTQRTMRPTEEPAEDGPKPGEPCNLGQYLADPASCSSYYRCVLGELKREQCAPGLHWDSGRGICDWPSIAKCQVKTGTTTRRPWASTSRWTPVYSTQRVEPPYTWSPRPGVQVSLPARHTTSRPNYFDGPLDKKECEHGLYYTHPNSCADFLTCVNGELIRRQCGSGLNWDEVNLRCDWAYKKPCSPKHKKSTPLRDAPARLKDNSNGQCVSGSYSSVPGDCSRYQACLWGRHEVFQCAPGLHFNRHTSICDWPSRADCVDDPSAPEYVTEGPSTSVTWKPSRPVDGPTFPSTTQAPWKPPTTTQSPTTLPSAAVDPDKVSPLSGYYKVVCYFTNWAWYRRGVGRYLPENIDHTLCTHIVYGFAVLDYSDLTIKAHDSWADFDNKFYERVVAYKKRGLKVLLALGGWNDSAGNKYSRLVNSPTARRKFTDHAVQFLEKYDFDGLDLDWEYPVCWQVDCKKGPASDKQGFADLLKELSSRLRPNGLLLTAAVSPSKKVIDHGYDVPALQKYLDWIAVMTYDFHGQWDKKTGHVAPLYYHYEDDYDYFNANFSINYWIAKGAQPRTIVMGMPLYGQSFSINDPSSGTALNAPASAGNAGEFTRAAGFLAYYEICDRIRNRGWTAVQDPERRMGPYAYKGNQWVSFDDVEMIKRKAQFVRDMGLGGGMVWALDLDDFRGRCGEGPHPLMHGIQQVLANTPTGFQKPTKKPVPSISTGAALPTTTEMISTDHVKETRTDGFKVICYFTNWAWYRQSGGKFLPEDIDTDLCTHVLYGFAVLDGSSLTIKSHDPWADVDNKFYERVAALKSKGIKVLMAIGGWNDSAGDKYSRLVNSASARRRFIEHVIRFIEKYEFEGLDLDWEYPVCWQVDCKKGPESDKEGFSQLVKELSDEFKPKGLLLSAAVSPSKRVIDAGYDVPVLAKYLDWISVMTYDYHGQWDKKTGHVAPLYEMPGDWEPTFNANFSIHYWMQQGAPAKKLVMGAPLYGQSFSLAETKTHGLNVPTYGGGEAGEATRARGFLSYYEICERTLTRGWTVIEDRDRRIGPYAFKGDQWVSFDDTRQMQLKAELIKKLNLGGGMVWALDLDDFKNTCGCEPSPLLRTMNRVLRDYPKGPLCPIASAITTIDVSEFNKEPPTTEKPSWEQPSWEPTTTSRPIYQPSTTTTSRPEDESIQEIDDTIEVDAGPPTSSPESGECDGRLFIPHKSDCSKYFLCNFGQLSEHSCPAGLYWNENRCDWPENTKCKGGKRHTIQSLPLINGDEAKKKKVVCYFSKWTWKRPNAGQLMPEDIDGNLCTHVIYGSATLDSQTFVIHDSPADKYGEFVKRTKEIRAKTGLKVLLGLGGWQESMDSKFSELAHSRFERRTFAVHASKFLKHYGFDGLDILWEYPVCWQVDCQKGPPSDREAFALLLKDISAVFKKEDLLLSAAVSTSKEVLDVAYDVPLLSKYLDWIGLMSFDYHGYWDGRTGHVAPLYNHPDDQDEHGNVNASVSNWIEKGVDPKKLLLGLPAYGQSYTLAKMPEPHVLPGFGTDIIAPGHTGEFTRSAGVLSFFEICDKVKNDGWTVERDPEARVGPYATQEDQWVSYDDVSNVLKKGELIRQLDLGGGMVWSLDLDDFKNHCGCGNYPLLTSLNIALGKQSGPVKNCT